jgi:hypothetical protein
MSEDVGEATSKHNASTEPKKAEESRYCKAKHAAYKYCQKAARHLCKPKKLVPSLTLVAVISYTALTGCQLIIARDSLTQTKGVYGVNFMPCDYGNCADDECSAEGIPPPT